MKFLFYLCIVCIPLLQAMHKQVMIIISEEWISHPLLRFQRRGWVEIEIAFPVMCLIYLKPMVLIMSDSDYGILLPMVTAD